MCVKDLDECDCICHEGDFSEPFIEDRHAMVYYRHAAACCYFCMQCNKRIKPGAYLQHTHERHSVPDYLENQILLEAIKYIYSIQWTGGYGEPSPPAPDKLEALVKAYCTAKNKSLEEMATND